MPNKKEKGLEIRVPVGDLLKKGKQSPTPSSPFKSGGKKLKPKQKKKKNKLTEQQKKNVDKDATIMEKEDIPGTPHFRMVPKKSSTGITMKAAKGGSVKKFPDLSGDGKVTQKDILMGRGVIKRKRGGDVHPPKKNKSLKQLKTISKSVGVPGATAGLASGIGKLAKKIAGRLATRGYGKARK